MNEKFVLYQDPFCPFCSRVKHFLDSSRYVIPMKDITRDREAYRELVNGGGRGTVPCLRIKVDGEPVTWLYESLDIIDFLSRELA